MGNQARLRLLREAMPTRSMRPDRERRGHRTSRQFQSPGRASSRRRLPRRQVRQPPAARERLSQPTPRNRNEQILLSISIRKPQRRRRQQNFPPRPPDPTDCSTSNECQPSASNISCPSMQMRSRRRRTHFVPERSRRVFCKPAESWNRAGRCTRTTACRAERWSMRMHPGNRVASCQPTDWRSPATSFPRTESPNRQPRCLPMEIRNPRPVCRPMGLLKKGTGSERPLDFSRKLGRPRRACPLFQQAAMKSARRTALHMPVLSMPAGQMTRL